MIKFLESITWLENDVLIPIDRIKFINRTFEGSSLVIKIVSDDGSWEEHFGQDEEKCEKRYRQIIHIIRAK